MFLSENISHQHGSVEIELVCRQPQVKSLMSPFSCYSHPWRRAAAPSALANSWDMTEMVTVNFGIQSSKICNFWLWCTLFLVLAKVILLGRRQLQMQDVPIWKGAKSEQHQLNEVRNKILSFFTFHKTLKFLAS